MSLFDSIISGVDEKFGLGNKAGTLVSALLALMTDQNRGGFAGFLDRFSQAGLGDLAASWISSGVNTELSEEQAESALGEETITEMAHQADLDASTTRSALAYLIPNVVDRLTPDGVVPEENDLLSRIGDFLSGIGGTPAGAVGAAGVTAGEVVDRVDAAAGSTLTAGKESIGGMAGGAMSAVDNVVDGDGDGGILKWLLPLILLGLLLLLGFWFCSKPPVATPPVNANANKTNVSANQTAKATEGSFRLEAKDGKYIVTGVVPSQAEKAEIEKALKAQFGEANVDVSGLKVQEGVKFGEGWWSKFSQVLPSLKDWKTGSLTLTGNAMTEAVSLPQAAIDSIKLAFKGWTLPASLSGATAETDRKLTEVSLPDGKKLQAYPGGIEDQLIKFIQSDEYKNGTADSLKEKWFNFDDLNFKFGTAELVPESKRQLDNIVAILKAFPDVKIKIGGYTDKKGDDAGNKKLSDERAKAVKSALEKSGVTAAQVPEAEGYGEEFAKVAETASDQERAVDRKTSVRLLK